MEATATNLKHVITGTCRHRGPRLPALGEAKTQWVENNTIFMRHVAAMICTNSLARAAGPKR